VVVIVADSKLEKFGEIEEKIKLELTPKQVEYLHDVLRDLLDQTCVDEDTEEMGHELKDDFAEKIKLFQKQRQKKNPGCTNTRYACPSRGEKYGCLKCPCYVGKS